MMTKYTSLSTIFALGLIISGCAKNQIVSLDEPTIQKFDLEDHDKDGVIEARDKCAATVKGALIDNYGCGTGVTRVEPLIIDIKFANNSYEIPDEAYSEIQKLAEVLTKDQRLSLVVEGHTSKVGSATLNQTLSENRANAVVDVLIHHFNISESRISSVGHGYNHLLDEGEDETAHAKNRRIMANITHSEYEDTMKWTIYSVDNQDS